jgi:site-specific DNA-methyltransferase (adenine-specific)
MAVRIEDAGFEIRDMIAWVYGSGFPKSHNLKDEWKGWGTALKPALEPITVARKPLIGTVSENVLEHGTGGLNIDGCRVTAEEGGRPLREVAALRDDVRYSGNALAGRVDGSLASSKAVGSTDMGRWPANLIHDGSDEVVATFPQDGRSTKASGTGGAFNATGAFPIASNPVKHSDVGGSAARFFYCAKASKRDRDEGLEAWPEQQSSVGDDRSGGDFNERLGKTPGVRRNVHPTVKPTDLMRFLCRLVTPPGGVVLDPFMGSGSTGKAAMIEGFQFIGCEMSPEYFEISKARIEAAIPKDLFA